jgi:hypothetical protein
MAQKLFQIFVVSFLVIFTVVGIVFLLTAISSFSTPLLSGSRGITFVAGGISGKLFNFLVIVATVLVVGISLLWRRRRLH